jgi:hypothetical protein
MSLPAEPAGVLEPKLLYALAGRVLEMVADLSPWLWIFLAVVLVLTFCVRTCYGPSTTT